jgi:two-component system, LytTR family, response regulator
MNIRALIVDDEPLARESLRLLLAPYADIAIAGEAGNGRQALTLIRREKPDLLFLDVQMPGMNGLDVLRRMGAFDAMAVIFVTAYDRYAIQAFESRALDYLLKPYTDERFQQVLARARAHIHDRTLTRLGARVVEMLAETEHPSRNTLAIRDGRRTVLVRVDDIDWIEATDYYVRVHAGGKSYLHRESLKSLAATLDARRFVRVHRSALVNATRIECIEKLETGDAVALLSTGDRVRVSRGSSLLSRDSLQRPASG